MTAQPPAIAVYTQPKCVQCDRTKAWLTKNGIEFTPVDITEDADAYRYVTEDLGYRAVPVVVVAETEDNPGGHWYGYRPDHLGALTAQAVTA